MTYKCKDRIYPMKNNILKENKQKIKDLSMSITAIAVMNIVIQFVMYPFLERNLGVEKYGVTLSVISVIAILAGTLGTSANYSRMVTSMHEDIHYTNGDYNIILLVLSALCGVGSIFYLKYLGIATPITSVLIVILMILTAFRYYSDVQYKMSGNFFRYMLFYISVAVGYIIGILVYRLYGEWMLALIVGELTSFIFAIFSGTIYRKDILRPSKDFMPVCQSMGFLLLSTLIENLTLNADRLVLMVFAGGGAVTVYYVASLLGKVIAMLSTPINSLIISNLLKYKGGLTKKMWTVATLGVSALGLCAFIGCTIVSPLLNLLYPDLKGEVERYIAPSIIGQIFYFISGILLVILLKFRGEKNQFLFNLAYVIEFFAIVILGTYLGGLDGFVYSALAANAIRFIAVIIWGFIPSKKKVPQELNSELQVDKK